MDYERYSEHTLMVRSTDNGRPPYSVEQEIKVHIKDINEAPAHIIMPSEVIIKENSPKGFSVTDFTIDDPDTEQFMNCSIDDSSFAIQQNRNQYKVIVKDDTELNFEGKGRFQLEVVCQDELYIVEEVCTHLHHGAVKTGKIKMKHRVL